MVAWMAILYYCSWAFSLSRLFGYHFWDPKYALEYNQEHYVAHDLYNSTAFGDINATYFSPRRYHFLLPHVLGAVFWWNLYFLQLVPRIRHAYGKKLHRVLGRFLMVCVFSQTASGVGLALTTHSNVIVIVSLMLALASFYCIFHAWKNAIYRDIPKHKYWVLRLVGYMQTIAFQRFYIFALIISHQMGWHGLYPPLDEDTPLEKANQVVLSMFDDSFILSVLTAMLGTEWYLAGEVSGMLEPSEPSAAYVGAPQATGTDAEKLPLNEIKPLLSK